jgi:acyl carrier protein
MPSRTRRLPAALGAVAPLLLIGAPAPAEAAPPPVQLAAQAVIDACGVVRRVRKVVTEALGVDKERVTMDARLAEDLGADSLDMATLRQSLEQAFAIDIAERDCAGMATVGDAVSLVERLLGDQYRSPDGC